MGFFPVTISVGLYCWRIPAFSWWAWKMLCLKLGCLLSTNFSEYSRMVSRALHIREGEKMRMVVVKWWCLRAMTEKRVFKSCSQRPTALVIELKTHKTGRQAECGLQSGKQLTPWGSGRRGQQLWPVPAFILTQRRSYCDTVTYKKDMTVASLAAQTMKNLPAMQENPDSIPALGRSPGEGNGNPLQ